MLNPASRWNPGDYAANAGFVPALGGPVLALLDPKPGERILDLGCGDGVLTERIAAAGADVLGVDLSDDMLAAARARGLTVEHADGQALAFADAFDAVFTNAALHWMLDPPAVAAGVFRALKAGGRYVGEMGGDGNIVTLRTALREALAEHGYTPPAADPQWYATADEFTALHEVAGFDDIHAEIIKRPTPLPTGSAGWFRTFRAGFLDAAQVPDAARDAVTATAAARADRLLARPDGTIVADYVRLRFSMRKP